MSAASCWLMAAALLPAQAAPPTEFHQDLRHGHALLPPVSLVGPDAALVARPDDRGLRVTLPADRKRLQAVGIVAKFAIAGDFEITGAYELLSADRPERGFGVGVNLMISPAPDLKKVAKLCRFHRVKEGNAYLADMTLKEPEKKYQHHAEATQDRSGHLRLVREGSLVRFQVAEARAKSFRAGYQTEFGKEDIGVVRFVVNTGESPAAVDARLVDLRIRSTALPNQPPTDPRAPPEKGGRWIVAAAILVSLLLSGALGFYLWRRKRDA